MTRSEGNRRIDRILRPGFVEGLADLPLDELRRRRDECHAEREHLSLLRRLVQGRAEILKAELDRRDSGGATGPLVEQLAKVLAPETSRGPSRGEAVRIEPPPEEMMAARRRVERLVADAGISDPGSLGDPQLASAVDVLAREEREVSGARSKVLGVLDVFQAELKRRYKEDPGQVLHR
ncbi:MAG: RsiG family protein [Actinomycetota bacterium]